MIDGKFWMVYGLGSGAPTVRHNSYEIATREAERLARNNPGIEFFVMMPVAVCQRVDVQTRALVNLDDLIPF